YYYELLIKRQLIGPATSVQDIDVWLAYLTELAHEVSRRGSQQWSESWMMDFHARFVAERKLRLGFRNVLDLFVERGVLKADINSYEFGHAYIYYFFAGRALSERLSTPEGRANVVELTNRMQTQDNANILLYLTHHSKDAAVIEPLLAHADSLFEGEKRADLASGKNTLPGLEEALKE